MKGAGPHPNKLFPRGGNPAESAEGAACRAAEGNAGAAGRRHHAEQLEGLLGSRCQRFRTRFGAVQTGRYGGKGRAVGGGFQVRASRPAEKTVNIVNVVNIVTAEDSKA